MNESVLVLTLAAAVITGTPIALAALGALLNERAGVLNLGIEGIMLVGAVSAFLGAQATGSPLLGLVVGGVAGAVLASLHGFLCVTMRANQVVSGLALVIFGTGVAVFLGQPVEGQSLATDDRLARTAVPLLEQIPAVGRILFQQDLVVYGSWVLVAACAFYLARTRTGLAVRAVGESPATADAAGIRVALVRYVHVALGGALAGMGGAYITVRGAPWDQAATTGGRGWIAIALVVFASWRPLRALAGAFLFGVALRANFALQAAEIRIVPPQFLTMLPYVLTIAVLVVLSATDTRRRLGAPAALGTPFVRDER
ncbi:ABC transporter permease [Nitriliruptoraceae bacterium ZYF776]|nr:ABC transporter permease [Profundirhabdus halotolerans]